MMKTMIDVVYWAAALVVIAEALNKIERTELFAIDEVLRSRLAALRTAPTGLRRAVNRVKCFGWRLVSMYERAAALLRTGGWRSRLVDLLRLAGWGLLSAGAGGALISPLFEFRSPDIADVCTMTGFAVLVIRSRVREGVH